MAKKRSPQDLERGRQNYKKLKEAGFSTKEAQRFRYAEQSKVNKAIKDKKLPEKSTRHATARQSKGARQTAKKGGLLGFKGTIPQEKIHKVEEGKTKLYERNYNYLLTFKQKTGKNQYETKNIVITSSTPMSKSAIAKEVEQRVFSNDRKKEYYSPAKAIKSSLQLEALYIHPSAW